MIRTILFNQLPVNTGVYDTTKFVLTNSGSDAVISFSNLLNAISGSLSSGSTGPQGPSGATGPSGAAGPSGAQGASGQPGLDGKTILNGTGVPSIGIGVDGDFYFRTATNDFYGPKSGGLWSSYVNLIGPTGAQGPQGLSGTAGVAGPQGPSGATGVAGPQGPSGATGAQGVAGPSGLDGKTILNGTGIPTVGLGVDGDFYVRTSTYDFYGPKSAGSWSSYINLIGPTGATGVTGPSGLQGLSGDSGKTILNGTGVPLSVLGVDGDFYLRTSTYDFYGPKSAGNWSSYINIIGPTGATGAQGIQGIIGPSGATGATGPQGPSGATGAMGPQGISGISGLNGKTILNGTGTPSAGIGTDGDFYFRSSTYDFYGPKDGGVWSYYFNMIGPTGATGAQGIQGIQGPSGATGAQGPQGISGISGLNGNTILNGTGIPSDSYGTNGDFYLRTTTYDFYGPKSGGLWSGYFNLIGPTGATGPQGLSGAVGATGPQGPTGVQGPTGSYPSGSMGAIYHGATSSVARLLNFDIVTWIGSVEPSNAINNDIWINTA